MNILKIETQDIEEKINILFNENQAEAENTIALEERIKRYNSLRKIIEEINRDLSLEFIADNLVNMSFSLITGNKGVIILHLISPQTHKPEIFKTKKENKNLVIRAKEGDIFDYWILRHSSSLFIEDAKKDFRFDLEKIKPEDMRLVSSLISSPLISENKFLGILRLDHPDPGFYSQDDLRFLLTICDLGAIALENGSLFQKVQDLAIHDELTSLYTKGYFIERLQEESKRCLRRNIPLSLLMIDIDYFKNYNDKFGHSAGDIVLQTLSAKLITSLSDFSAIISRFGGEEFCVILSEIDKNTASDIAERLRVEIENTKIILRQQETKITVSIGVSAFPIDTGDENELVYKADRAMYEAKQEGRNKVILV